MNTYVIKDGITIKLGDIYKNKIAGQCYSLTEIDLMNNSVKLAYLNTSVFFKLPIYEVIERLKLDVWQKCQDKTQETSICDHNWTELTLFTSSIIYCQKCDKEKKD